MTKRMRFHSPAPKRSAASSTSLGMACKPETTTTMTMEVARHLGQPDRNDDPVARVGSQVRNGRADEPQPLQDAVEIAILREDGIPDDADGQVGDAQAMAKT